MTVAKHRNPTGMPLAPRHLATLQHFANGLHRKRIADAMDISPNTIGDYLKEAFYRLGVKTIEHAIAEGFRKGLLK